MNIKTRLLPSIFAIALICPLPHAQLTTAQASIVSEDPISSNPREATAVQDSRTARPGDIATGFVLDTGGAQLRLNIRPCEAQSFVVIFHQPYNRSTRGQKNCAGQNVTIEQIQQN